MRHATGWIVSLTAAAMLSGVACGDGAASPSGDEDSLGSATIALAVAPDDVRCLRVTVEGSRVVQQSADVTPGQPARLDLTRLPIGSAVFVGEAFETGCSAVTAASIANWVSTPVEAVISRTAPLAVVLEMRRNGRAEAVFDFVDDDAGAGSETDGGSGSSPVMLVGLQNANRLVDINPAAPAAANERAIVGLIDPNEIVLALDFRSDGTLFALGASSGTGRLYEIAPSGQVLRLVGTLPYTATESGFDFRPGTDAAELVDMIGVHRLFDSNTGTSSVLPTGVYAVGEPNVGQLAAITAMAFAPDMIGLDHQRNAIVRLVVNQWVTAAVLPFDVGTVGGLEEAGGVLYGAFLIGSVSRLFRIELNEGFIANLGDTGVILRGITAKP
jgi:hypothetical protein